MANGERSTLTHDDRLSDGWPALLPLAQQFLDNQRRDIAVNERALERDTRLAEQARALSAARWRWTVVGLSAVCLAILILCAALILQESRTQIWVGNVNVPLLIVSHVGLLTAGLLIGSQWAARHLVDEPDREGSN